MTDSVNRKSSVRSFSMQVTYRIFLLTVFAVRACVCETENNSTTVSRRQVLEQQAREAYQNACLRLQELSNWMNVVFRIKSVWASSTVNEIAARSDGILTESDRRNMPSLPSRLKLTSSECSLESVRVTAQTYAYLQSQMVLLKTMMGRNILKSGKEKLEGANVSLRERMKVLDVFNSTLNDVVSKLIRNTQEISIPLNSESLNAETIEGVNQESSFLHYLQNARTLLGSILENQKSYNMSQVGPRTFFQNLGKSLDRMIFPIASSEQNNTDELSTGSLRDL